MGGASRWWLHHALISLNESLAGKLNIFQGDPQQILGQLAQQTSATAVMWNRCYEPWRIARDGNIKLALKELDIQVDSFNGSLLWEPWQVLKKDETPYKVFTPYYRRGCLSKMPPRRPLPIPANLQVVPLSKHSVSVDSLQLLPSIPWDTEMKERWVS